MGIREQFLGSLQYQTVHKRQNITIELYFAHYFAKIKVKFFQGFFLHSIDDNLIVMKIILQCTKTKKNTIKNANTFFKVLGE